MFKPEAVGHQVFVHASRRQAPRGQALRAASRRQRPVKIVSNTRSVSRELWDRYTRRGCRRPAIRRSPKHCFVKRPPRAQCVEHAFVNSLPIIQLKGGASSLQRPSTLGCMPSSSVRYCRASRGRPRKHIFDSELPVQKLSLFPTARLQIFKRIGTLHHRPPRRIHYGHSEGLRRPPRKCSRRSTHALPERMQILDDAQHRKAARRHAITEFLDEQNIRTKQIRVRLGTVILKRKRRRTNSRRQHCSRESNRPIHRPPHTPSTKQPNQKRINHVPHK